MAKDDATVRMIMDFTDVTPADAWAIINDGVMGGRSESDMRVLPDSTGLFAGRVSLENNGGFASTRTLPRDFALGDFTGLRIRVLGDGRRYQFRIRTDSRFDGVAYKQEFDTREGEWLEIDLPFADFQSSFRGRPVPTAGPLDAVGIRQLGFLIADKNAGAFRLQIDWIRAYKNSTSP
jgi:NADH dehydrogenase [ubiquinone] 1 alpha subcomplex assembly factor 1